MKTLRFRLKTYAALIEPVCLPHSRSSKHAAPANHGNTGRRGANARQILARTANPQLRLASLSTLLRARITCWNRYPGISGTGRSNLRSDLAVMTASGHVLSKNRLADCFLAGWTRWNDIVGYRDGSTAKSVSCPNITDCRGV